MHQDPLLGYWFGVKLTHSVWNKMAIPWWCHRMETFSALLALCVGNSPVAGEFPSQRPVMWSFDVFFDLQVNKQLGKQSWGWWFETPSCSLWRQSFCAFELKFVKLLFVGVIRSIESVVIKLILSLRKSFLPEVTLYKFVLYRCILIVTDFVPQ